jgi:hypothetical protein
MTIKTYTVAEAKKHLSKLIRGPSAVMMYTSLMRRSGFEGKIFSTPDAFDPLSDEDMKELGFE